MCVHVCVCIIEKERDIYTPAVLGRVFSLCVQDAGLLVFPSAAGRARPLRILPMYICTHMRCVCAQCVGYLFVK